MYHEQSLAKPTHRRRITESMILSGFAFSLIFKITHVNGSNTTEVVSIIPTITPRGAISRCGGGRDESLTGPNVLFIVWLLVVRGKKRCMTVIDTCLQYSIHTYIVRRLWKDGLAF